MAVIGGGPAGLSAAYFLRLKGHRVKVFEAQHHCGGHDVFRIPRYRLPLDVLGGEIQAIQDLGVEITRTGAKVENLDAVLGQGFDAVFLGLARPSAPP